MPQRGTYYAILGVVDTADEAEIHASFRTLMRRFHPDINRSPTAPVRAAEISEAFRVLGNWERRAAYDRELKTARLAPRPRHRATPMTLHRRRPSPLQQVAFTVAILALASGTGIIGWKLQARILAWRTPPAAAVTERGEPRTRQPALIDIDEVVPTRPSVAEEEAAPPPVTPSVVTDAVAKFAELHRNGGFVAAKAFSERCHHLAGVSGSWDSSDFCAALDHAAFLAPTLPAASGEQATLTYFLDMHESQQTFYARFGVSRDAIAARLDRLRAMVEPIREPIPLAAELPQPGPRSASREMATPQSPPYELQSIAAGVVNVAGDAVDF